jgi:K+-sensing histidine kinase KdpD
MSKKSENAENNSTIVVCIDTTSASQAALKYACYKAKTLGFNIHILAVMEGSHKNLLFASKAMANDKRQQLEKHLQKLIKNTCDEFGLVPAIAIKEGDIFSEITRELKFVPSCKLLVFGKSISSQSDNTVLPKIIARIGNKIKVPVTIVPENISEELMSL